MSTGIVGNVRTVSQIQFDTILVDSRERDVTAFPSPYTYDVTFQEPFHNAVSVELSGAEIGVCFTLGVVVADGSGAAPRLFDVDIEAIQPPSAAALALALQTALVPEAVTVSAGSDGRLQFKRAGEETFTLFASAAAGVWSGLLGGSIASIPGGDGAMYAYSSHDIAPPANMTGACVQWGLATSAASLVPPTASTEELVMAGAFLDASAAVRSVPCPASFGTGGGAAPASVTVWCLSDAPCTLTLDVVDATGASVGSGAAPLAGTGSLEQIDVDLESGAILVAGQTYQLIVTSDSAGLTALAATPCSNANSPPAPPGCAPLAGVLVVAQTSAQALVASEPCAPSGVGTGAIVVRSPQLEGYSSTAGGFSTYLSGLGVVSQRRSDGSMFQPGTFLTQFAMPATRLRTFTVVLQDALGRPFPAEHWLIFRIGWLRPTAPNSLSVAGGGQSKDQTQNRNQ